MTTLPSPSTMYQALVARDSEFEGVFYAGVRTTGIFCRPTCPARKPKPENVEFFGSPKDALYAGYRPCARCHPLDRDKKAPELVTRLRQMVDDSPAGKITDADLRALGIDPSTARRQFRRYYGMTFQAYHRARRMGLALHQIRSGESVIGAQIDTGFESASGFWKAFKQVFGAPPSAAEQTKCLLAQWVDTPLGSMVALGNDDGIHLFEFTDCRGLENEITRIRKRLKCPVVPGSNRHLDKFCEEIRNYFDGVSTQFTGPMLTAGTPFEQAVWEQLRSIPPGKPDHTATWRKKSAAPERCARSGAPMDGTAWLSPSRAIG